MGVGSGPTAGPEGGGGNFLVIGADADGYRSLASASGNVFVGNANFAYADAHGDFDNASADGSAM